jgi:hypothetical protein
MRSAPSPSGERVLARVELSTRAIGSFTRSSSTRQHSLDEPSAPRGPRTPGRTCRTPASPTAVAASITGPRRDPASTLDDLPGSRSWCRPSVLRRLRRRSATRGVEPHRAQPDRASGAYRFPPRRCVPERLRVAEKVAQPSGHERMLASERATGLLVGAPSGARAGLAIGQPRAPLTLIDRQRSRWVRRRGARRLGHPTNSSPHEGGWFGSYAHGLRAATAPVVPVSSRNGAQTTGHAIRLSRD